MQINKELMPMFSYTIIPVIIFFLLWIGIILLLLWIKKKKKTVETKTNPKKLYTTKEKYLRMISYLEKEIDENKINNRKAFQKLSKIIRLFVYEMTSIKLQNYSLDEIKTLNIEELSQLVEEYYDPEFAKYSKGDLKKSIEKTKKVIELWK